MQNKTLRIVTAQDISCFGQCSITVALPILSSLGIETAILPTAILSTHTAGFQGFTFHDLKDEVPNIVAHWQKEKLSFDAVYTGYLGNEQDVAEIIALSESSLNHGPLIVDPAFGDNGKLYGGFDDAYVKAMARLCAKADVLLPNLTEASALLGIPYNPSPSHKEIVGILRGLSALGAKIVVLKGTVKNEKEIGLTIWNEGKISSYAHARFARDSHGTGDVFASAFTAAYLRGLSIEESAKIAADFTYSCLKNTPDDHAYGVKFEPLLFDLEATIREAESR